MPKRLALLCPLLVLFLCVPGNADEPVKPLVWAGDASGKPYIYPDDKDPAKNIGFEVELAEALSRELHRPIEFKQYEFKNLILGLDRGDFDFAMNGLEVTPDRKELVRFSRPYYVFRLRLTVRATEDRIHGLADCRKFGGRVGTLENTSASRLLDSLGIEKVVYDDQEKPYRDLELGRTDAVLMDQAIAQYSGQSPQLKAAEDPIGGRGYYAIAFRKSDAALASEVDAALGRLLKNGELRRIYVKWGLWNDSQDELLPPDSFYVEGAEDVAGRAVAVSERTFWSYLELLRDGAVLTIEITLLSMALAVGLGMLVAVLRLYGPGWVRWLMVAYVEFFRGVPVLLLLYLLYYALPPVGHALHLGSALELAPLTAAVLGLGLNYAAYEAEIYRAGIASIPEGQWEAAASLGMTPAVTFRRVILPQALRTILPPSTGDFVALFKDTSIVSGITLIELSKAYQMLTTTAAPAQIAEIGAVTASLYLAMSLPLGHLSRYLERRWDDRKQDLPDSLKTRKRPGMFSFASLGVLRGSK